MNLQVSYFYTNDFSLTSSNQQMWMLQPANPASGACEIRRQTRHLSGCASERSDVVQPRRRPLVSDGEKRRMASSMFWEHFHMNVRVIHPGGVHAVAPLVKLGLAI